MSIVNDPERESREQYLAWKRLVPYLYDSFINHHLPWPSLSCRWGPMVHETATRRKQRLYLSEQTDGSEPNKLTLVTADIAKPRISTAEAVSTWGETVKSPYISAPIKTLVHPGEVNKLLDVPNHPSVIVTHSDCSDVFVWNFDTQKDRLADLQSGGGPDRKAPSTADFVLKGHTENAEFALSTSSLEPCVASGGKDTNVLVWSLEDGGTSLSAGGAAGTELKPRHTLEGHYKTVEDVAFRPGSAHELASVADDYQLLFWDTRAFVGPVARVTRAHTDRDVHCVDWNAQQPNLVVTGAQDGGIRLWDKRNLGGAMLVLNHHSNAVMNVEWSPHRPGVFASGADDGLLCIWDIEAGRPEGEGATAAKRMRTAAPHQLLFQHSGHQSPVVDFCWNAQDLWTLMSASVDVSMAGGGTLQVWRVSDLIHRPEEEVMAELEPYKDYISTGDEEKLNNNGAVAMEEDVGNAASGGGGGGASGGAIGGGSRSNGRAIGGGAPTAVST